MQALGGPGSRSASGWSISTSAGPGQSERPKDPKFYSLVAPGIRRRPDPARARRRRRSCSSRTARDADRARLCGRPSGACRGTDPDGRRAGSSGRGRCAVRRVTRGASRSLSRRRSPPLEKGRRCDPFAAFGDEHRSECFDATCFPNRWCATASTGSTIYPASPIADALGGAAVRAGRCTSYRFARPERITMPLLFIAGGEVTSDRHRSAAGAGGEASGRAQCIVYPNAGPFHVRGRARAFRSRRGRFRCEVSR